MLKDELLNQIIKKEKSFEDDIQDVKLPFELISAMASIVNELNDNNFKYSHKIQDGRTLLIFKKTKEKIIITISKDNLEIRHFDIDGKKRKLRVLYVADPAQRKFTLL